MNDNINDNTNEHIDEEYTDSFPSPEKTAHAAAVSEKHFNLGREIFEWFYTIAIALAKQWSVLILIRYNFQ